VDSKPYITCQQLIDFIMSYLENELAADQRAEFDPRCGRRAEASLGALKQTRRSVRFPAASR
jgi:hypothetical protein